MTATGGDSDNYEPESQEKRHSDVTFENIAGMEEIKEELMEIADFIKDPAKYRNFGAKLPKGVLFYGPPGTGKTMIAKALANEANVDFIYASGSEFIEKYVGVGAGRIRTLFENARKRKNCIVFIDEIDAIGASRNTDSNSERDQTLNQLLIEMDGFNSSDGIVLIGATNRIDLLDKALVRPGRFDRQIYVGNPSMIAREKILAIHMKGKPISGEVNIKNIASRTTSMSGAEIANVVNEAAILAIRNSHNCILSEDFDEAILKTTAGIKNNSVRLSDRDLRTVAIHEAGHAMAHIAFMNTLPQKITVVSRAQALGMVVMGEREDDNLIDTEEFEKRISVLLAGRAAEEVMLGRITTGAQNDLRKANELAVCMFTEHGMSNEYFNVASIREHGGEYRNSADKFVSEVLNRCYKRCTALISDNKDIVLKLSEELINKKTISEDEIREIVSGDKIRIVG
ncbi:MAG: AAA family ATPase [Eubacteriaceae bacterium]|nr:AAA family ATPase [Eubacteriaceae bacterium]